MRCINGKQFLYSYTSFVSYRNERKYRLISLLTSSTLAFSCLEYASVRLWGVPVDTRNSLINSLAKCEPRSDLIIWDASYLPKCWRRQSVADFAVLSAHQNSSVHRVKAQMMTRTCEESGKGPMKSIFSTWKGLYAEVAYLCTRIGTRAAFIFWQHAHCCINKWVC